MALRALADAPLGVAAAAGHHAIQLIRGQWRTAESITNGMATAGDATLTAPQVALIEAIVVEIEAAEGTAVTNLSENVADRYIHAITDQLEDLSRRDLGADEALGRHLLGQLRESPA